MTRLLVFVGLLALVGCGKKHEVEQKPAEHGATTATTATTSNAPMPAFSVKPIDPGEAQDLAELKNRTSSLVSKWLTEQPTSDGFIATYETPIIENVQDEKTLAIEKKQTGVLYGVYVRRMIDGQPYKCVAPKLEKRADVERVVDACKTAKP